MNRTTIPFSHEASNDPALPRGRPNALQSAQIVERILAAAWNVLLEQGPEQFSIDRVAIVAQASKQTIYARFCGKLPLLQALLAARLDLIFTEMRDFTDAKDAEAAFAHQARRAVASMVAPPSRMLDRLVDWIDANLSSEIASPTRAAIYAQSRDLVCIQLVEAGERWNIVIDDVTSAAGFWLDGLFGHVRGLPSHEYHTDDWPARYSRYFLRAVTR